MASVLLMVLGIVLYIHVFTRLFMISPKALKRDLKLQKFSRHVRERLTRTSPEPSPYEKRLEEIRQIIEQQKE